MLRSRLSNAKSKIHYQAAKVSNYNFMPAGYPSDKHLFLLTFFKKKGLSLRNKIDLSSDHTPVNLTLNERAERKDKNLHEQSCQIPTISTRNYSSNIKHKYY